MANCYTFTFNQLFSTFIPVKQISNHINLYQVTVAGTLVPAYSFLSVTELPEYVSSDDDLKRMIQNGEKKLQPGTPEFDEAFEAAKKRNEGYKFYRLQEHPIANIAESFFRLRSTFASGFIVVARKPA